MNNYERIKAMSIEEMAKLLNNAMICSDDLADEQTSIIECKKYNGDCTSCLVGWLESEVEE